MQIFKLPFAIYGALCATLVHASPCTEKFGIDEWVDTYKAGLMVRSTALSDIRSCVATTPGAADKFDLIAITGLKVANAAKELSDEQRISFIRFNASLLWLLAEGNDATAQHNLAVLHNAQPGSFDQRAIKQDPSIFMYWTRRAASQGEPQSLFNLAMRLSRGVPAIGLATDPAEAYKLILQLEQINKNTQGGLQHMMPTVAEEKKRLAVVLGSTRAAVLETEPVAFAKLAPEGPLAGTRWDSEENVGEAVTRVYAMAAAREEPAAWEALQRCYAEALGVRTFTRAHEYCLAFDVALTQWSLAVYQHTDESIRKPLAKQFEKAEFMNRSYSAFLQAGLSEKDATSRFAKIGEAVARATEKVKLNPPVRPKP